MKIDILTLFPDLFNGFLTESIIKRAINDKLVEINLINFREYSSLNNHQVDDTPYGGGAGMVLRVEPIYEALKDIRTEDSLVVILTPAGKKYTQKMAYELKEYQHLIIICGHYEGFDERILSLADLEISIGDYVLTGGEIPAMVLCDSITRLIPGVIKEDSHLEDSFNNQLLDYPTYTKPREFMGMQVPEVLISGDHEKIKAWRKEEQIKKTKLNRPDLLEVKND